MVTTGYLFHTYLLQTILIGALYAHAAPAHPLSLRDAPFGGPQTVQTHNVIAVAGGRVVEDCTITLTPIVINGQNLVKEERRCTDLFVPDGQDLPPGGTDTTSTVTTTTDSSGSTAAPPPPPTSAPPAPPPAATTDSSSDSSTDSVATTTTDPASTTDTTLGSLPDSSTTAPASTTDPGAPASAPGAPSATGGQPVIVLGPTTTSSASNEASGTRANESAPTTSTSGVSVPGKKFEVLPIGLGVFAGISVIALIVVGLVTYERTKYRKAFRQRRLAASGAEMGYGGMSERR